MMESRRLQRSNDAVIAGICAGIAEYFDIDVVIVRVLAIALGLASFGVTAIAYALLWLIIPAPTTRQMPIDVEIDSACAQQTGQAGSDAAGRSSCLNAEDSGSIRWCRAGVWFGIILLLVGFAGIFASVIQGIVWWRFWPVALIIAGVAQILLPAKSTVRPSRIASGIIVMSLGLLLLACSLDILDWTTISNTFNNFWSLLVIMFGLLLLGGALHKGTYIIASSLVFALFCILGLTLGGIPGDLNMLIVQVPFFDPVAIDVHALLK